MTELLNIEIEAPRLAAYQKDFLYNGARFTFTEASTKAGKTFAHIWWIFERAHQEWNKPGHNHWWVAPVYGQAKIAFRRLKNKIARSGLYKINEAELRIECPNGAVISFMSAKNPDTLYGDDVYSVVFDEAPRAKVSAWYALRTTITATKGKFKAIGNFGGISNWMHQLKEKSKTDEDYAYYKITAWDAVEAGILDRNEIEQARKDLPENIFKQLYLAEGSESDDQLIPNDTILSLWENDFVPEGIRYITADIAFSSDRFVVLTWSGWRLIDIGIYSDITPDEVTEKIKGKARHFKVQRQNIIYDADGVGAYLKGYLRGSRPFYNGGTPIGKEKYKNLKSQCGYHFARFVNEDGMHITASGNKNEIIEELECLKSHELDKDGKMEIFPKAKIKELIGRSPDILDALVMRAWFDLKGNRGMKMY